MSLFYPPYGNVVQRLVMRFYLGVPDAGLAGSQPTHQD
jgi:hypothetical protein